MDPFLHSPFYTKRMVSTSWKELQRLVALKRLTITLVLGLPRGGTTAIEKHIFGELGYDANVNEPSLETEPTHDEHSPSRAEVTFAQVLAVANDHLGRVPATRPVRVLVKEVTNKVLPFMVPLWERISDVVIVVVRNPSLQMESRLKSILDRITSGALQPFGLDASVDIADTGDLVGPDACFKEEKMTWEEAWKGMCQSRDYSQLGPGLARVAALHPFCAIEECQQVVWGSAGVHGPLGLTLPDFSANLHINCAQAFLNWRIGWVPLLLQLPYLNDHPNVRIFDFSCFQMDPQFFIETVRESVAPFWGEVAQGGDTATETAPGDETADETVPGDETADETVPGDETADETARGEDHRMLTADRGDVTDTQKSTNGFQVVGPATDWERSAWDMWYGRPCFSKVTESKVIEPVKKPPIPFSALPCTMRGNGGLALAYRAYLSAILDPRSVHLPRSTLATFAGIDEVHDELWQCRGSLTRRELEDMVVARVPEPEKMQFQKSLTMEGILIE